MSQIANNTAPTRRAPRGLLAQVGGCLRSDTANLLQQVNKHPTTSMSGKLIQLRGFTGVKARKWLKNQPMGLKREIQGLLILNFLNPSLCLLSYKQRAQMTRIQSGR